MNCYLCVVETHTHSHPACGICYACGSGICEHHLVVITRQPVSGMAAMTLPRRRLLCSSCHEETVSAHTTPHTRQPRRPATRNSWWRSLLRKREPTLPEPQEVILLAEQYLQQIQQKTQDR